MKFWDYHTTRDITRTVFNEQAERERYYSDCIKIADKVLKSRFCHNQMILEESFERMRRPYYNVYPAICKMLTSLSLKVDTGQLKLPMEVFAVRLPVDHPCISFRDELGNNDKVQHIRSILVGPTKLQSKGKGYDGITIIQDFGETENRMGIDFPIYTYTNLPLEAGMTLEEAFTKLPMEPNAFFGTVMPREARIDCIRLVCSLCLLENDPSIIQPDVLDRDAARLEGADAELLARLAARAKQRGKVGWNIGKGLEVIPHIRRPHPCIVHTGKGRTVAKIVMRKGSIIHHDKVDKLPTGFQGDI